MWAPITAPPKNTRRLLVVSPRCERVENLLLSGLGCIAIDKRFMYYSMYVMERGYAYASKTDRNCVRRIGNLVCVNYNLNGKAR
jgi:hypothetical protein